MKNFVVVRPFNRGPGDYRQYVRRKHRSFLAYPFGGDHLNRVSRRAGLFRGGLVDVDYEIAQFSIVDPLRELIFAAIVLAIDHILLGPFLALGTNETGDGAGL